ncbi:hypothetical protein [Pseudomonas azadiae]|uniref:Uncharacterized protein n=1 Tax=Pseudomonas azadiae TaxID=2843612 RepID=A0ABS6P1H9_9PSED|nr:hypothetical protein [Pseudomonas azadiae]MBV4454333.1 hypothetical protein [Pseudomonas azadiae]
MLPHTQKTSTQAFRKVVALVLIIPLLLPLMRAPLGLGRYVAIATVGGSLYGAWYAWQHTSRSLAIGATLMALLNLLSLVAMGTASIIWFVFILARLYGSSWWYYGRF